MRIQTDGPITTLFIQFPKRKAGREYPVLIDTEDLDRVLKAGSLHLYQQQGCLYVSITTKGRTGEQQRFSLHRFIKRAKDGQMVDHEHGNGLDNRKSELRFANHSQNRFNQTVLHSRNTSGIRGLSFLPKINKWKAVCRYEGKDYIFGYFSTKEEAAETIQAGRQALVPGFKLVCPTEKRPSLQTDPDLTLPPVLHEKNTSGVSGVSSANGMWRASLNFKGVRYFFGQFHNKERAIEAIEVGTHMVNSGQITKKSCLAMGCKRLYPKVWGLTVFHKLPPEVSDVAYLMRNLKKGAGIESSAIHEEEQAA